MLPRYLSKNQIIIPPIIQQGSKNKLLSFLFRHIAWNGKGVYYEPFCGGGVVLFNLQPKHAIVSDINPYLIDFYTDIQEHQIDLEELRELLVTAKRRLLTEKDTYWHEMRDQFNTSPSSELFFFLNMTCRRNIMRFNSQWKFNAPFLFNTDHNLMNVNDPEGLFIDRMLKRIRIIQKYLDTAHVEFYCRDFHASLQDTKPDDLVYCDPPYIYKSSYGVDFSEQEMQDLATWSKQTASYFAISNWYSDAEQINPAVAWFQPCIIRYIDYIFCIGTSMGENNENNINVRECLLLNKKSDALSKTSLTTFFPNMVSKK